ncbi:MAG: Lysophospholipid transporter LplT / 2-acylglycerophosphoethanolamine acyltransferase / Acyl-[acyl-carrier-protein] synthetase [uncultured Acetobacteraceae bacterium]|uniref:Lysophospholipid transporter LplT / 2-acylglycerophosphoethanolamine acyltransferase / Acyl-[acyl-carrier-protein] synthetase n=1 Tax=uncultured Acetobacteraceae bacterium TaxID=169975 RepID=A0A6J4HVL7_9PROT|nr:MAG: Lysophospholipid transporter LplT / 2-acylglycerophosphoethanolamine acyltransferase / Acyl-[acyl-carrier-protein] synthetase [uncultured Acetobacteraceae bacterium]
MVPGLIYGSNATILFGTDTFLAGYARTAHAYDLRSVRYVLAGAEPVKPSTRETWLEKFGLRVLEGYGVTETAPILALNTPMANRFGTIGRLMPGIEARLGPRPSPRRRRTDGARGPRRAAARLRQNRLRRGASHGGGGGCGSGTRRLTGGARPAHRKLEANRCVYYVCCEPSSGRLPLEKAPVPSIRSALAAATIAAGITIPAAGPASAHGSVGVFIGAGPPVYYAPPPPPPPVYFVPPPRFYYPPPPPVYYAPPPPPRFYYAPPPAYRYRPY